MHIMLDLFFLILSRRTIAWLSYVSYFDLAERKEIITEIVETEIKYGRDLRIIVEEFYRPMLVAGLLTSEQLAAIFLNVDELIQVYILVDVIVVAVVVDIFNVI